MTRSMSCWNQSWWEKQWVWIGSFHLSLHFLQSSLSDLNLQLQDLEMWQKSNSSFENSNQAYVKTMKRSGFKTQVHLLDSKRNAKYGKIEMKQRGSPLLLHQEDDEDYTHLEISQPQGCVLKVLISINLVEFMIILHTIHQQRISPLTLVSRLSLAQMCQMNFTSKFQLLQRSERQLQVGSIGSKAQHKNPLKEEKQAHSAKPN